MVNVTLNADGTLTIAGPFSVSAPDFTLKAADGTGFVVTNIAAAQAATAALQTKITNAQKALA